MFAPLTNGALTITDDNTPPTLTDPTPNLNIAAATLSFAFDEHINVSTISLQNISITDATGTGTVLLTGATLPATNSSSVIIGLTTAQIQQLGTLTFDDNAGTPLQITVSPSAITDLTGNAFGGLVAGTAIDTTDDSTAPTLTSTTLNLDTAILVLTFNEAIVWSDTTLDNITITDSNNANPVTLTGANLTDNNLPTLTITLTESQRQSVVTLNTGSNSPVQITVAANSIHDLVGNVFAPLTNGALTITDDNTPPTLTDLTPNLDIAAATLSFAFDEHINVSTISLQNISITDATGTGTVLLTGATLPATNSSSVIIGLTTAQIQQLGTLTFDDNAGTPLQITVSSSAITDLTGNAFGGLVAGTAIDTTDDSTAPTLTSTTLNLDTAILVLTFNEVIVWSDTTLDNITITDSNNANPVTLTGANLTDNNLPTLTITLTESQRQSVVTLNTGSNSPVQITVAANSIRDLVGNAFAPLANGALTITDDNTPPTLTDLTPNLDIAAATLTFAFDEHINVSTISLQNISITDAAGTDTVLLTGATLPATNSSSVIIGLTTAQIQQLGTLTFDDDTPLQITVSSSAITDLTGNAFGGLVAGTAIDTTDDSTAPTLTSTTLNLDTAILVLTFNEAIDSLATTLDNITITDSNNANPVTLTGANLTDNNLPTLTITLTESQRQSVVTLNTGSNSPVQITVAANSIRDLVGNVFAPLTNGALTITDDNTPPTLTDPTPNLNIAAATLSFAFDEHINVSTISLQNISITDATGTGTVLLTGATLPATNSSSFIIGLTTAQVQQLGTLTFDDNAGTPLQITVSPSAITDLTGNAFGGLVAGTAIDTTDDSTAPTLTSTTLNLDTAILVLTFNEAIVWSDTTLDNITITDSNNANPVTLTGANLTDNNLPTLTITLTESQRQSVVTLNTGSNSPVQITVAANSIHDLVGNVFAPLTNGALTITDDNTPPTLTDLTPNLDIAAATLSFAFDEHINVSTISLQNISITDATGTGTVLLTGATLPATNSSSVIIGLTTAQIQQLGTLTFDDNAGTPLQITVSSSAITDLTGNAFGGLVAGTAIDTTDDSTAPTLTSTTLNLDTAILVLTFNEVIVWSDTTLDNITITDSNNANPVTLTGANLTDNNLPTLTITLTESQRQSVVTLNTGSNSPVQITVAANSIHDLVGNVFASLTNGALTITDDNTPPTLTDLTPNLDITAATLSFAFDEHINVSTISLQNISITDAGTDTVLLTGATLPATNSSSVIIGLTTAQIQQLGTLTFDDNAGTPLQIIVSPSAITDLTGNAFGGLVAGTAIDTTDDSTAPTLTNTTLNLDTAILVLTFNEAIVWSDTTLDNITITDSNNANPVTLTGANLTDNNLPTLTVTLTESQRQSVVTLNTGSNSPVQITVAANSIHDLVGNVFASLTNGALTITDDNTPPTLTDLTPNLDITAATLSFAFDEHINVSTISLQNISITDAAGTDTVLLTGATLPATNSSSVIIGLTAAQILQLVTLTFDDDTQLQITVSPSAITDLTGNAFGGLVAGTAIDTTDDSTAPTLTNTTLNLDTAILVLTFNEAIVWSDTTLDNITITDSNNTNPVTLTGANLTDNNLPTLTITLTESQRQSVVTLNTGSNSPVQITVAANSIRDLVGNAFAPLANGALTITDDNTPPTLTDLTPNLDIAAATLTFAFDEHINVSTISLQNISITDATGTDTVLLTGATLPATNSSSVIIGLTTAQIQQLGTLTFDDDTPLQITVSSSAITDLTGNAFGGLVAGTVIDTTDDSTAPTLTSTTLNLDTAILVLTFNEAIDSLATTLDNITITDSNIANPVTLTGANLTDNNLPTLTITLTESQRQSVVTLNTGSNSPVQITVAANSIRDLVGNAFAPLANGALTITDDNTPPTLTDLTPNLDIAAATLSFAFDEHINVSTISLQNISITDTTGTDTVLLTGATLPATNSSSFIIGLTTAQVQQLGTLTFDDNAGTPLQITVSPSAITDLTGNAFLGLAGTAIDTTDDSTAPTLTSTTLNLDTAILVLTFNEDIVWSDTTLDNITITDSNNTNPVTLTGANLTDNNLQTLTITLTESQRQSVVTLNTGSNSPVQITVAANSIRDLVGNVFAPLTNGALTITDDNTPPTLTDPTPNLDIGAATLSFAFDEHINVSTISLQNISITDATGTGTVLLTGATLPATNSSSVIIGLTTAQILQLVTLTFDDDTQLQITVSSSAITDLTGNAFGGLAGAALQTTSDATAPPFISSAQTNDTSSILLTFSKEIVINSTPSFTDDFVISGLPGSPTVSSISGISTNQIKINIAGSIISDNDSLITLSYARTSGSISDLDDNVLANFANIVITNTLDTTDPVPVIAPSSPDIFIPTGLSPIPITITFSEPVSALTRSEVTVINGDLTVLALTTPSDNTTYRGDVIPSISEGIISVTIPSDTVTDARLNGNVAAALEIQVDRVSPVAQSAQTLSPTMIALQISEHVTVADVPPATFVVSAVDTDAGTSTATVSDVSLLTGTINNVVLLTIDAAATITASDTITVSYTGTAVGDVSDASDNALVDFADLSVTNNVSNPPAVSHVYAISPDGTYRAGDPVDIGVLFTKAVTVTASVAGDNPMLLLETGAGSGDTVTYTGVTDGNTLTFRYTVAAGDVSDDLQYRDTSSLVLPSGTTITESGSSSAVSATIVLPTLSSVNSLASNSDIMINGILTRLLSADMRGENSLEVSYNTPVTVTAGHYTDVIVDGVSRNVITVSGSDTSNVLVYFDGPPVSQGASGIMNINSHVTVAGQSISARSETVSFTDNDPVILIARDIPNIFTINDETTTMSVSPVLGLHPLGTGNTLTLPTTLISVTFDHNADGNDDVTATFPPNTKISNLGSDQTVSMSVSEKTVTPGSLPAGATLTDGVIVDLGDSVRDIQFDNPVIIDLVGRTGETGFFVDAAGLTSEVLACNGDHIQAANGNTITETVLAEIELRDRRIGECSIDTGTNLRIYSLHFSGWGGFVIDDDNDGQQDRIPRNRNSGGGGGGGGGGHGASTPPSFTTSFATGAQTIIINNVGISPKSFSSVYVQDNPVTIPVDRPIPFSFTLYDDESWQSITHLELCIDRPVSDNTMCDGNTKVIWDKNDHNGIPVIIDPNNVIDTATLSVTKTSLHVATFDLVIVFDDAVDTTDLQIRSWDGKRNMMEFTVENAFTVTGSVKSSTTSTDNKQTASNNDTADDTDEHSPFNNDYVTCNPGKVLLPNGTCMDPEPGTFACLSDQVMLADGTCRDVTTTTTTATTTTIESPGQQAQQKLIITMWAGFHSSSATDRQILDTFDVKNTSVTLPTWLKSSLGSWVAQDRVSPQEFEAALHYLAELQDNS